MSTPIIELIAQNIATAVGQITIANDFNFDLTAIRPQNVTFSQQTINDGKVLIWQGDSRAVGEPASMSAEWNTDFFIEAVAVDAADYDSIDTLLSTVAADIEKKLKEDHTRGGYALDCAFDGVSCVHTEEFTSAAMTLIVHWRHKYDDPYNQI